MVIKNVLMLCKRTSYQFYFLEHKDVVRKGYIRFQNDMRLRFKKAHEAHYKTIALVESVLLKTGVRFTKHYRGRKINYAEFDCVITVGGDGTFLEAARHVSDQIILGVNSDPSRSIGRLCSASGETFERVFLKTLRGNGKINFLERMRLRLNARFIDVNATNDLLFCHQNPAAMSRYHLSVGNLSEEQRSSGLWVATPAGSSGAIHSAGRKIMRKQTGRVQFMPRELFKGYGTKYRLTGGVVSLKDPIVVCSLMRSGVVYVDGSHFKVPFTFGDVVSVFPSKEPLRVAVDH